MNDSNHIRPPLPKPPSTWLTLLMGAVLLVCGIVIGAGGTTLIVQNRLEQPDAAPSQFSQRLMGRMTRDLDLTDEQAKEVRAVFQSHSVEMRTVREEMDGRVDVLRATMQQEVRAILTPEQVEKWEKRIQEYRRDRHGPPHDDGSPRNFRDGHPPRDQFDGPRSRDGRRPPPDGERPRPPDGERPPPPSQ
ncbi:MAG: hypothetical protein VCD00_03115 [Candidatus Hydrogenedentota bacterium]